MDYERVVLENLPLVDAIVRSLARRHRLSADEADDLGAAVRLKLVDRDYEVLRRFKNESSLRTYLTIVINRHFLDRRIAVWGKWRPSAVARRRGPHAVLLDQFMTRDGLPASQAVARVLATCDCSRGELEAIVAELPHRARRRFADAAELADLPAGDGEQGMIDALDRGPASEAVEAALSAALSQLGPQDRMILKMRYCDDCTVARIARVLGLDQKGLYRRLHEILRVLRHELERRGVDGRQAAALIGHSDADLPEALDWQGPENAAGGPSVR